MRAIFTHGPWRLSFFGREDRSLTLLTAQPEMGVQTNDEWLYEFRQRGKMYDKCHSNEKQDIEEWSQIKCNEKDSAE